VSHIRGDNVCPVNNPSMPFSNSRNYQGATVVRMPLPVDDLTRSSFFSRPVVLQRVLPLILVLVSFMVYHQSLSNGFQLMWDDQWVAMNDYTRNGLHAWN